LGGTDIAHFAMLRIMAPSKLRAERWLIAVQEFAIRSGGAAPRRNLQRESSRPPSGDLGGEEDCLNGVLSAPKIYKLN